VKARSAVAATAIVAVALVMSAAALIVLLHQSLMDSVDTAINSTVRDVSAELRSPAGGDASATEALRSLIRVASRQGTLVQVLSPSGAVVAVTADLEGEPPLSPQLTTAGDRVQEERKLPVGEEDTFRLIKAGVATDAGTFTVIAAQSLERVNASTTTVLSLLAIGYPLLLVIVGASTFWFVGRSLQPVEAMRAKVAGIGGRDLTERVPVPRAQDEVARLAVTMNEMLDRLEAAQLSQRRFVADASHELRSPIATLKTIAEVNLAHPERADSTVVSEGFLAETRRLERLVGDLLLLAHADESGFPTGRLEVDLDDVLSSERDRVRSTTDLTVTARISAVRVRGNPHQLAQAVRNLVDNAIRHARSKVDLALYTEGNKVVIEVADDGPGIPEADRERVFDRFVRLDESRERGRGGSGLGLAIVQEIVHAHGGVVMVADTVVGATLRVMLPLAEGSPLVG
jgi:signal transduction histidine kinase